MSDFGFGAVEQALRLERARAAYLAADAANAATPGFVPRDLSIERIAGGAGAAFSAAVVDVDAAGSAGIIEYTMGATAKNAVRYRALADQERAMLREFRAVAEEGRR